MANVGYPDGCRQGKIVLVCKVCEPKQQQACADNYRIEQAKIKKYGGLSNAEIAARDNAEILKRKMCAETCEEEVTSNV